MDLYFIFFLTFTSVFICQPLQAVRAQCCPVWFLLSTRLLFTVSRQRKFLTGLFSGLLFHLGCDRHWQRNHPKLKSNPGGSLSGQLNKMCCLVKKKKRQKKINNRVALCCCKLFLIAPYLLFLLLLIGLSAITSRALVLLSLLSYNLVYLIPLMVSCIKLLEFENCCIALQNHSCSLNFFLK